MANTMKTTSPSSPWDMPNTHELCPEVAPTASAAVLPLPSFQAGAVEFGPHERR
jgi:hypothetical protein